MSNDKVEATYHPQLSLNPETMQPAFRVAEFRNEKATFGQESRVIQRMSKAGWSLLTSEPEKFWRVSILVFKRMRDAKPREIRAYRRKLAKDQKVQDRRMRKAALRTQSLFKKFPALGDKK